MPEKTRCGYDIASEVFVTKDEDPTGLLNEGFRYRDLETGTFITRDPLGFVDGPNVYSYVMANPWTFFDPQGLRIARPQPRVRAPKTRRGADGLIKFGRHTVMTPEYSRNTFGSSEYNRHDEEMRKQDQFFKQQQEPQKTESIDNQAQSNSNSGNVQKADLGAAITDPKARQAYENLKQVDPAAAEQFAYEQINNGASRTQESPTETANPKSTKKFGHTFKTHGAGEKNTKKLLDRARTEGQSDDQGQWMNDQAAADFLANTDASGVVEIPEGLGQTINKDGSTQGANFARIVRNKDGNIKTAFPVTDKEAEKSREKDE